MKSLELDGPPRHDAGHGRRSAGPIASDAGLLPKRGKVLLQWRSVAKTVALLPVEVMPPEVIASPLVRSALASSPQVGP